MKFEVKNYTANEIGKDYVVGDIHGEFKRLKEQLDKLGFNPSKDRLFSVGDLCDRGPYSEDILDWMDYKWFIPVRGNHESVLISKYQGVKDSNCGFIDDNFMRRIKAEWFMGLSLNNQERVIDYFMSLPIAIEIKDGDKKYGIVHAICPYNSWDTFKKKLKRTEKVIVANKAMWSLLTRADFNLVKDIDYVFVGHNTIEDVDLVHNTFMLDTGSGYRDGKLSIFNISDMHQVKC